MKRKAIIVVLTLGAVSVTAMSVISHGTPLRSEEFWLGDRDIFLFSCDAGHAKLVWLRVEEGGRSLYIGRRENKADTLVQIRPSQLLILDRIEPRYVPRVRWRTMLTTRPPSRRTQIQVWAWLVIVALAAYPMLAFIRGPLRRWRRRRRSLCIRCGYNLEGNVSGVCPECGEAR